MRISPYLVLFLAASSLAPIASAEVSFLLNVDRVRGTGSGHVDVATGAWLIVADIDQDGFAPLAPGGINANDFVGSNDMIIFRGDFTTFGTFDGVVSGAATGLNFSGGWDAGDPLAFVWFPTPSAGIGTTSLSGGEAYGFYTSATGEDTSDPWITPPDGTLDHSLQLLTDDAFPFFGAGSIDSGLVSANLTVIPEPSVSLLGLLSALLLVRRRR